MKTRLNLYRYHSGTVARHNNRGEWGISIAPTDSPSTNAYEVEPGRDYSKYTGVYDTDQAALDAAAQITGLPVWIMENMGEFWSYHIQAIPPSNGGREWVQVRKVA